MHRPSRSFVAHQTWAQALTETVIRSLLLIVPWQGTALQTKTSMSATQIFSLTLRLILRLPVGALSIHADARSPFLNQHLAASITPSRSIEESAEVRFSGNRPLQVVNEIIARNMVLTTNRLHPTLLPMAPSEPCFTPRVRQRASKPII